MDRELFEKCCNQYISPSYVKQGLQNLSHRQSVLQELIQYHRIPVKGLDDTTIEYIMNELAAMDTNNFHSNTGVGEREGRVFSSLVSRRHYGLAHGIGRSGDISEVQPKAAGSSMIYKLTNKLVSSMFKLAGLKSMKECLVVPLATGMTCALTLKAMKSTKTKAKYVIWSRIDQKSCFKSILYCDLTPITIEPLYHEKTGEYVTNIPGIIDAIKSFGAESILAVISTTSCFAPRQPDLIDEISKICKEYDICHLINNAYGIQSSSICKMINRSVVVGRVDAVIQSTDKNFLVPVGGAIIASPSSDLITIAASMYPGRASASPIIDLFITILSMGQQGYQNLLKERELCFSKLQQGLSSYIERFKGSILPSPRNDISIALTIPSLTAREAKDATFFGSMLFHREISGCRVVHMSNKATNINGFSFINWNSHSSHMHDGQAYFTVAAAIGMSITEVDLFLEKLTRASIKFERKLQDFASRATDSGKVEANGSDESIAASSEDKSSINHHEEMRHTIMVSARVDQAVTDANP